MIFEIGSKVFCIELTEDDFALQDEILGQIDIHDELIEDEISGIVIESEINNGHEAYLVEFADGTFYWFLGNHLATTVKIPTITKINPNRCAICKFCTKGEECMKFHMPINKESNLCSYFKVASGVVR